MGRTPCCEKEGVKKGRWSPQEDDILRNYILAHGEGSWRSLPINAGLQRCGKSCRLRWINYLRSELKRGNITPEEDQVIIKLHSTLGNRWSTIVGHLPGRTDNEIKNYWNSHLRRKLQTASSPNSPTTSIDLSTPPLSIPKQRKLTNKTKPKNPQKTKKLKSISVPMPPTPIFEEGQSSVMNRSTSEDMEGVEPLCFSEIIGDELVDQKDMVILGREGERDSEGVEHVCFSEIIGDELVDKKDMVILGKERERDSKGVEHLCFSEMIGDELVGQKDMVILGRERKRYSEGVEPLCFSEIVGNELVGQKEMVILGRERERVSEAAVTKQGSEESRDWVWDWDIEGEQEIFTSWLLDSESVEAEFKTEKQETMGMGYS